jgi:hypothetical protein
MIKSLRSVLAATVRGAPGSRVPLTNGFTCTRMRRHPSDRPIFIRQGWPQAMSHLPWNHQEPLCAPPFPQVTPDRRGRSYRFSLGEVMRSLPSWRISVGVGHDCFRMGAVAGG